MHVRKLQGIAKQCDFDRFFYSSLPLSLSRLVVVAVVSVDHADEILLRSMYRAPILFFLVFFSFTTFSFSCSSIPSYYYTLYSQHCSFVRCIRAIHTFFMHQVLTCCVTASHTARTKTV